MSKMSFDYALTNEGKSKILQYLLSLLAEPSINYKYSYRGLISGLHWLYSIDEYKSNIVFNHFFINGILISAGHDEKDNAALVRVDCFKALWFIYRHPVRVVIKKGCSKTIEPRTKG